MRVRYRVTDPTGLHARPAATLVKAVSTIPGAVRIAFGSKEINGKSILQVLSLGVHQDDWLELIYETDDKMIIAACEAALATILSKEVE